jgi:hypothetical protein
MVRRSQQEEAVVSEFCHENHSMDCLWLIKGVLRCEAMQASQAIPTGNASKLTG